MQKKTKTIIMIGILLLILISISILALNKTKSIQKPINQLAQAQYTTTIGSQTFDITNAVLEANEIIPTISAGMIPVKWDGANWVITTKEDEEWYNYEQGKTAYIMLNDGVYQSELLQYMTGKKLAKENIGIQIQETELGTIYMWIPRYAYNETGEIIYIKQGHSVAGTWTIPETFIHKTDKIDFSLSGIWVEYKPLTSKSAVTTKVNNMKGEENKYGFIANTVGVGATDDPLTQTTIEQYINVIGNDALIVPPIIDIENTYRTILNVVDTNKPEPIKAKAYYDENEEKNKIEVMYKTNAIEKIIDVKGKILSQNSTTADTGDEVIGNKVYKYIIIDNKGNQKEIILEVSGLDIYIIENLDDLKLFRNAVNAGKTTEKTKAYQVADIQMNEGKYTINEETGEITFAEDAEQLASISGTYKGKYYGGQHTISGIYGSNGLFNICNGAEIRDLGIINSYMKLSGSGTIMRYAQGNTILENCYSLATIEVAGDRVGGLVGETYNSSSSVQLTINNCYNKGKIILKSGRSGIGGIIGFAYSANIKNCYNVGEIVYDKSGGTNIGGIAGYIAYGSIQNAYNIGNISVNGEKIGGIVGNSDITIKNCYNTGNIIGQKYTGGIVGIRR